MIGSLAKAPEFNAAELKDGNKNVETLEGKVCTLMKENCALKDRAGEYKQYSRRWNLRIKGMKELISENTEMYWLLC